MLFQGWTMDEEQIEINYQDRKKLNQDYHFIRLNLGEDSAKTYLESDATLRDFIWQDALDAERQTSEMESRHGI
jgi:hypothetical protein